jgi:hypothetical protein
MHAGASPARPQAIASVPTAFAELRTLHLEEINLRRVVLAVPIPRLRHTFPSRLVMAGVDLTPFANYVEDVDLRTTSRLRTRAGTH